ncbi:MAG: protein-glutamine glutaminase family protein [Pirellulaceae bacterium]
MPQENDVLSVAAIREQVVPGSREILFLARQSIFWVGLNSPGGPGTLATLDQARQSSHPVRVLLDTDNNEVLSAQLVSAGEKSNFEARLKLLPNPDPPKPVDLKKIDPSTFNIVTDHLTSNAFVYCPTIVPGFAEAQRLFDICAGQSCHLGAPSPCITFQYLLDGCHARAHKMRYLIENEGYCCAKAFAFAPLAPYKLASRANKWGHCCVAWWFHVVPLVPVQVDALFQAAMVIDPSMFDRPVLYSTWLESLEDTSCYAAAKVMMQSVEEGTAYGPADATGDNYHQDDDYSMTDAFLLAHESDWTCP